VIGVPKTIDNDLGGTEVTFGFDTALMIATEALDRLHTTAEAHHRVMVLELMGREAGFIALHSGVSGGADVILLPEIPFKYDAILQKIRQRAQAGSKFSLLAVSEGARPLGGQEQFSRSGDAIYVPRLAASGRPSANISSSRATKRVSPCSGMSSGAARRLPSTAGWPPAMARRLCARPRRADLAAWWPCATER